MRRVLPGFLTLAAALVLTSALRAISLDQSFGDHGIRVFFTISGTAVGVGITADGRILVAGSGRGDAGILGVKLVRLTSNGSNDPSFGSDGYTEFFASSDLYPVSLALQPDGRILVGGWDPAGNGRLVVLRFLSGGSLDTTFGAGGLAFVDFAPATVGGGAMALQSDGKIVLAGSAGTGGIADFAAARLNADGTLDTSFGSSGRVVLDLGGGPVEAAESVAILADGRILLGGRSDTPTGFALAMARLLADGSPDPSFGAGGKTIMQIGQFAECRSLVVQRDGRPLAVGTTFPQGPTLAVRLQTNGAPDPTFGSGGVAILNSLEPNAAALDSVGGIDIAGDTASFAFTRLLPNGSLDPGVGPLGFIEILEQGQGHSHAGAIALQRDGRAVVAGDAGEFFTTMAVARFAAEVSTIPTLAPAALVILGLLLGAGGWWLVRDGLA